MEALVPVPLKIVCLETYWGDHHTRLFQNTSVRPFLEALGSQFYPPIRVAHRFVESMAHLSHYTGHPDGLLWRDPEIFDAPVFYLSFHGSPGTIRSSMENAGARFLCGAFENWGGHYANLVHFGACSVFGGDDGQAFAREFLEISCCRAITGYSTDIDWMDSMTTDLLFLKRFFSHGDPWSDIERIHESVLADFAPARRLGFQLHVRKGAPTQPAAARPAAAATTITPSHAATTQQGQPPMSARFFIAWAVTFVAWMAGSFVVHHTLLHADYSSVQNLFRSPEEAQNYFHFMILAHALMAGAFVWIYRQGVTAAPFVGQGLRYGAAVAALCTVPLYLIYYVVQPMPGVIVAKQIVFDTVLVLLLGVLVASLHRGGAR